MSSFMNHFIQSLLLLPLLILSWSFQVNAASTKDEALIRLGRDLFLNGTFGGNGRTCATCHPEENNFTLDPKFIATLPDDDPLFVHEFDPQLAELEDAVLVRKFGLFLENVDGFDQPPVFRSVPHTWDCEPRSNTMIPVWMPLAKATLWAGQGTARRTPVSLGIL